MRLGDVRTPFTFSEIINSSEFVSRVCIVSCFYFAVVFVYFIYAGLCVLQIKRKQDVIASEGRLGDVANHYNREYRIYTIMNWILRAYRRDPQMTDPLLMVDVGKVCTSDNGKNGC